MNSIFISSSFMDMQHERDAIRYLVLPQVNDYLRKNYGQETTIIDLRWGIDTSENDEASSMNKIIRTCLFEIDNCKPFMIVLLGDRYGTLISKEQYSKYIPDAEKIYSADTIGVTELEIRYAMHLAKQDKMHILFYFRAMDYSSVPETEKESTYFDSIDSAEKSAKLTALKCEIKNLFPEKCKSYATSWDMDASKLCGINDFANIVVEDILKCITNELGAPQKSSIAIDDAFSKSRQISFVGREKESSEIEKFLNSTDSNVAFLYGEAGTGKSAIMANIPNKLFTPSRTFVSVYCGQGDFSDTAQGIMRIIVFRLSELLGHDFSFEDTLQNQTTSQWHSVMDDAIQKYLETSQKELVILIDGIDQMVQDTDTTKTLFLPNNYGGKVKVVLSAVSGYSIEATLPTLENASWISLKTPSERDIDSVIDDVWLKYGKPSVSGIIKKQIRNKRLSGNYLYVNFILTRLTFLGMEVFGDKNNSEQYIIDNIVKIINAFPDTLEDAANELLNVLGEKINPSLASEVFTFFRISENGLRLSDIQYLCNNTFDASDFSCLKMLLGTFMFERSDHRVDFSHKVFRAADRSLYETNFYSRYFQLAESLPIDDNLSIIYKIHSAILFEKYDAIFEMIDKWHENPSVARKLGEQLSYALKSNNEVTAGLLNNLPDDIVSKKYISFVADCLLPFMPSSKATKELVDGISNACARKQKGLMDWRNDPLDLSDNDLEAYSQFEKKRFDIHYNYSGSSKIETNRYYKTLIELARRKPTIARKLLVADFELDYSAYWDSISGTYDFCDTYLNPPDPYDFLKHNTVKLTSIAEKVISEFDGEKSPEAFLILTKAYIKKAGAQYPSVITEKNENAEKSISEAFEVLDKAISDVTELPFDSRKQYILKIAKCYQMISDIYMRVSRESGTLFETGFRGVELAGLRRALYKEAHEYYKNARTLFLTQIEWLKHDDVLGSFLDIIYGECRIITCWDYLEDSETEKIEKEMLGLIKYVEENMYLVVESQSLCTKYALLCSMYAVYLSGGIPFIEHQSERAMYPWSTVDTKEENYEIYRILEKMDYWWNRSLFLFKCLYTMNPSPGNVDQYIQALKNRLGVIKYYTYRSLETIDTAVIDTHSGLLTIVVSEDQIRKDQQLQRKRQFPVLVELCNVLRTPDCLDKELTKGLFILVAKNMMWLYPYFSNDSYLEDYESQLSEIESSVLSVIEQSITDPESFGYYLLFYRSLRVNYFDDFIHIHDKKRIKQIKAQFEKAEQNSEFYCKHRYSRYADEWEYL